MGQVLTARAGEALFLPRNQAHTWYVMSPIIRALAMTNPGGLDEYFEAPCIRLAGRARIEEQSRDYRIQSKPE